MVEILICYYHCPRNTMLEIEINREVCCYCYGLNSHDNFFPIVPIINLVTLVNF